MRFILLSMVLASGCGDDATGTDAGRGMDAGRRAGLIASQLLGLALCRYVLKLPPVVAMSDAEIVDAVGETVQGYLDGG